MNAPTEAEAVAFPALPPTTNELTTQQRKQLVWKTRKIKQMLGSTPSLIDASVRTSGPIPSGASSSPLPSPTTTSFSSRLYSLGCNSRHGTTSGFLDFDDGLPSDSKAKARIPLQLAFSSPSIEGVSAFPHATRDLSIDDVDTNPVLCRQSTDTSIEGIPSDQFATTPSNAIDNFSPPNSLGVPISSATASPSSIRKQKMDRVKKKLGSGVPLDLVFPEIKCLNPSENTPITCPSSCGSGLNMAPLPASEPQQQAQPTAGRFKTTRTRTTSLTIVIPTSVLHAGSQRLGPPVSSKQERVRKRPLSVPADGFKFMERLPLIVEGSEEQRASSPDDHDLEHSLGRGYFANESDLESKSFLAVNSAESLQEYVWGIQRGYEGWHPNSTRTTFEHKIYPIESINLSTGSTQLLKHPANDRSSSWDSSSASPTRQRRPASHRKPPPSFSSDLYC